MSEGEVGYSEEATSVITTENNPINQAIEALRAEGVRILDINRARYGLYQRTSDRRFKKNIVSLLKKKNIDSKKMLYRAIDGRRLPTLEQHGTDLPQFDTIMTIPWQEWSLLTSHPISRIISALRHRAFLPESHTGTPLYYSMAKQGERPGKPAILVYADEALPHVYGYRFQLPPSRKERIDSLKAIIRVHDDDRLHKTNWPEKNTSGVQ